MGKIFNGESENENRRKLRKYMTKAETLLWLHLKGKQIYGSKFRRQYSVRSYIVDFYSPRIKLAVEIDGLTHLTEEEIEYDNHRQTEIESLGI